MRTNLRVLTAVTALSLALASAVLVSARVSRGVFRSADKSEVERGKYLVNEVAKCPECHTPRDAKGQLKREAWLQGATIWITPVRPIPNWADQAPALASFPSFTEEDGLRILEQGTGPHGEALRPPMHTYHMSPADAKAIIAYLKSLPAPVH